MRKQWREYCSVAFYAFFILWAYGCSGSSNHLNTETDSVSSQLLANSTNIVFSMPTPLETALLFKQLGIKINLADLNSTSKANTYLDSKDKALNLGVYAVDFCFASVNDQSQLTLTYAQVVIDLLKQLGITANIRKTELDSLQIRVADKVYIKNFISENVLKNLFELTEDRKQIGCYAAMGTYVEGLYIILSNANKQPVLSEELKHAIVDQALVLENISSLIAQLDKSDSKVFAADINKLKSKFEPMKMAIHPSEQVYDSAKGISVIKSKDEPATVKLSKSDLANLLKTVQTIRKSYTK